MGGSNLLELRLPRTDVATTYVCDVVFRHWCQWPLVIRAADRSNLGIGTIGEPDLDLQFGCAETIWGSEVDSFLARAFAPEVLGRLRADKGGSLLDVHGVADWLDGGAISAIFWLLSGKSELASSERDSHCRILATSVCLDRLGVVDLPVVDLLADYLIQRVRNLFPNLPAAQSEFKIVPTHDVDAPYKYAFRTPLGFLRGVISDAVRGKSLRTVLRAPQQWWRVRAGDIESDPFNCFSRILDLNETHGLQSEFYFIANHSAGRIDGDYDISHPLMRDLLREVIDRGHIVGLHSSYNAPFDSRMLKQERDRLQRLAGEAGYCRPIDYVRNHFLRFEPRITPAVLAACGFCQDSTLAFAEKAGFRRGTCRPFPLWDLEGGRPLDVIERPLIAMECSLVSARYEGLSYADAADRLDRLKDECRRFGGRMVVLWHNNYLCSEEDFELYEHAIS